MKVYHFGEKTAPVLLLLPGMCCHWKRNFGEVIPQLKEDFHVVCVSYDGFDDKEDLVYEDISKEVEKIEKYILKKFDGSVECCYGSSAGGTVAALLMERGRIHMDRVILGSTDLSKEDLVKGKVKAKMVSSVLYKMVSTGQCPETAEKLLFKKNEKFGQAMKKVFAVGEGGLPFIKEKSIYNQYYTDLVISLGRKIEAEGTEVYCFYAMKMGEEAAKNYKKHFKNPHITGYDMEHEEFLLLHPKAWVKKVKEICGK